MYLAIFDYLDRVFACVRPRKLLFMAIDGQAHGVFVADTRFEIFNLSPFSTMFLLFLRSRRGSPR